MHLKKISDEKKSLVYYCNSKGFSPAGITWDMEEQNLIKGKMVLSKYQIFAVEENKDKILLSFGF